jgi:hypothetical protein
MKITVLALSFVFTSSSLSAQEVTSEKQISPKIKSREVGAFVQYNLGPASSQGDLNLTGLQYSKWITPTKGYRFSVSYGHYKSREQAETYAKSDTAVQVSHISQADLLVIGGAWQVQRKFYKRLYLFAALEMKAGYGSRELDTITTKYYTFKNGRGQDGFNTGWGSKNNMLYADLAPSVGAKLQFNRISIGTEFVFDLASYNSGTYPDGTGMSVFNLNLGKTSSRLFVNYRF